MKNEYRIKEVPPILERENQTPIFYPQIKEEVVKTSGYLWWKKTETTQEWKYLYKDNSLYKSGYLWTEEALYSKIVGCDNKEEAEAVIKKYKSQLYKENKEFNKKWGIYANENLVNIHSVE